MSIETEKPQIERGVSAAELRRLLRLDPETGRLFWRDRPESAFLRRRDWLGFQARLAGAEAFLAIGKDGYRVGRVLGRRFFAHRVVFALHHGHWPAGQIDHKDGCRLNNAPGNLRAVSPVGNCRNKGVGRRNTSGVPGVSFHRRYEKWQAQIGTPGRGSHLGYFGTLAAAVAARWDAEVERGYHQNHGSDRG